jgi:hypothetical protein
LKFSKVFLLVYWWVQFNSTLVVMKNDSHHHVGRQCRLNDLYIGSL